MRLLPDIGCDPARNTDIGLDARTVTILENIKFLVNLDKFISRSGSVTLNFGASIVLILFTVATSFEVFLFASYWADMFFHNYFV